MLKGERQKKVHHVDTNEKKAGLATLIWDKVDFKAKIIMRDKEDFHHDNSQYSRKIKQF